MVEKRRTIVITGGSRGIGHATGKRCGNAGWRVITCSRQPFPKDHPGKVSSENFVQIDLSNREEIAAGIEKIRKRIDGVPLNALVNNAAI
ncbi:MAG: SDR family NAD(P)-dependent oxidoreductase, partial [Desulfobacteraceae bacterium]|nr:SDR family NAD(P)-dependent oxidoreductase [Desulfobacteraceae bacterium]